MKGAQLPVDVPADEYRRKSAETEAEILREQDELEHLQRDLAGRQRASADNEMAALKPLWEEQRKAVEKAQAEVDAARAAVPAYKPQPIVDPESYQQFMFGMLGVALIGGVAGKSGWMRVSQSMNGAMRGLIEGSKERAQESYDQFKRDYDQAMGKLKSSQENMRDILTATDIPIRQILMEAEIQAKRDGAEDKYLLAKQGHIDKLRTVMDAQDKMVLGVETRNQTVREQMDAALARLSKQTGMAGGVNLDDYGRWFLTRVASAGNMQPLIAATSRWASPQRAEVMNSLGREYYLAGRDPSSFNQSQISLKVETAAQRWAKVRYEAIDRLETYLSKIEKPLMRALATVNGTSPRLANEPINAAISALGTGQSAKDLAYLKTLTIAAGRTYQELTTMPASQAQMHWGAQEMAREMVNENFTLASAKGFYEAVKLEVGINEGALDRMVLRSMRDVEGLGVQIPPPVQSNPRKWADKAPPEEVRRELDDIERYRQSLRSIQEPGTVPPPMSDAEMDERYGRQTR